MSGHAPGFATRGHGERQDGVTPDGDEIGRIAGLKNNVDPDPGLTDRIRSALDWENSDSDSETYRLQAADVSDVTSDTVVVHGHFEE